MKNGPLYYILFLLTIAAICAAAIFAQKCLWFSLALVVVAIALVVLAVAIWGVSNSEIL